MISYYKQEYTLLVLVIMWFILGKHKPLLATRTIDFNQTPNIENLTNAILPNQLLFALRENLCKQVNTEYQEIYNFETESYYINICQSNEDFYYYRQSKTDPNDTLLTRAKSVFGGNVFQATDNKTIYFVGKDEERHYSSVMRNNSEIVFEPELEESVLSLGGSNQKPIEPSIPVKNLQLESKVGVDLDLDSPENLTKDSLICTNNSSAFHPDLKGWHKLIGQSSNTANQYALRNGHDFSARSGEATITTQEGILINLNIATNNNLVERVCIQPPGKISKY